MEGTWIRKVGLEPCGELKAGMLCNCPPLVAPGLVLSKTNFGPKTRMGLTHVGLLEA